MEMALVFARNPGCLLADELMRSVDPIVSDMIGRSLRELAAKGCAVVVTGHEVNYLMPFLDSVTWVTSGTTYDLGSPACARSHEPFAREYLGSSLSISSFSLHPRCCQSRRRRLHQQLLRLPRLSLCRERS